MKTKEEVLAEASAHWKEKNWHDARKCYQTILAFPLKSIDQAKMMSNIMCTDKEEGNKGEAIKAGQKALKLIEEDDSLLSTDEGMFLHGYISGQIKQLEGKGKPWREEAIIVSSFLYASFLGALVGENLHGEGNTDYRYIGAVIGALLGWTLVKYSLSMPPFLVLVSGFAAFFALCKIVMSEDVRLGAITLGLIALIFIICFVIISRRTNKITDRMTR